MVGRMIQQILRIVDVLLLTLELRRGQTNCGCDALSGDDFISAIEDLTVAYQRRIARLDEAGVYLSFGEAARADAVAGALFPAAGAFGGMASMPPRVSWRSRVAIAPKRLPLNTITLRISQ